MSALALVADVGGTNTRIALTQAGGERPAIAQLQVIPTPGGKLVQAFEAYLRSAQQAGPLQACAVAAAGRVRRLPGRTWVSLTNARLTIDRNDLAEATGAGTSILVNDLAAVAAALPLLRSDELLPVGPIRTLGSPGVRVVVGVGTGLGLAALTSDGTLLESESGHSDLAAVSAEERQWLNRMAPLGRLSVESLLSGTGLSRLYEAAGGAPGLSAAELVLRATADEPLARKTLMAFSRWLGRVVGNMVLIYGAWAGVYLTGGVLDGLGQHFDALAFREGMDDKTPFSADLGAVPVYRIVHPQPALLGLANLALAR